MEKISYTHDKMSMIKQQVQKLIKIVSELEAEFPGRHFTLDGHLVGSIGEVDGRKVQIKISQQDNIVINHEPEFLIVLYLNKNGNIYEVYNGPGKCPWETASKRDSHNNRHMRVNKLMEFDKFVSDNERIPMKNYIEKMDRKYKNRK